MAMQALSAYASRAPTLVASCSLCFKYTVADLGAQHTESGEDDSLSPTRLALFAGFGFYYGAVNYHVLRAIDLARAGTRFRRALAMSLLDICVHIPIVFYPQRAPAWW